ncbi:uncharacterized protein METZ01_LOCUS489556, partial [marine metagenome]
RSHSRPTAEMLLAAQKILPLSDSEFGSRYRPTGVASAAALGHDGAPLATIHSGLEHLTPLFLPDIAIGSWRLVQKQPIPKVMTAGCMADTRAMDGPPWAKMLSMSQMGRVAFSTISKILPWSTGTAVSRYPESLILSKSARRKSRRS